MANRFTLQQFTKIFKVRNHEGNPYVLIGGQAVNYWAERYFKFEPELKNYLPFASGDIDFRGNRDDVRHIASQLDLRPLYPDKVNMTALAGAISLKIDEHPSSIEVVRLIPGVAVTTVDTLAIETELSGQKIRVLDPISLLICKANLALTVNQKDRQDVSHLKIMFLCVREFLRELLKLVEKGKLSPKGWLGAVDKLSGLSRSSLGRKASKKFGIQWPDLLPLPEINAARNEKIVTFCQKHLARAFRVNPE